MSTAARAAGIAAVCLAVAAGAIVVIGGGDEEAPPQVPVAEPDADRRPTPLLDLPDGGFAWIAVRFGQRVAIHASPGGKVIEEVGRRTEFGSPRVFSVVRHTGRWAGVPTPWLPNGQLGWVELDARRLRGGSIDRSIVVDLSDRRAELRRDDRVLRSFTVTIGMPGADTPAGRFAVTDTLRGGLNPAYGCCALAITATQPHLPSGWLGGNRIAIHATSGPLGAAISHGCVRASNADVSALVDSVPPGTPVLIRQ